MAYLPRQNESIRDMLCPAKARLVIPLHLILLSLDFLGQIILDNIHVVNLLTPTCQQLLCDFKQITPLNQIHLELSSLNLLDLQLTHFEHVPCLNSQLLQKVFLRLVINGIITEVHPYQLGAPFHAPLTSQGPEQASYMCPQIHS